MVQNTKLLELNFLEYKSYTHFILVEVIVIFSRMSLAVLLSLSAIPQLVKADAVQQGTYIIAAKFSDGVGTSDAGSYTFSGGLTRGTSVFNGRSEGAFTASTTSFSFQGSVINGNYGPETIVSQDVLNNPSTTTYSYPGGTKGMATPPLTLELWLPSFALDGTGALYVLTGSDSLNLKVTNTEADAETTSKYLASGTDIDPGTSEPIQWSISGTLSEPGTVNNNATFVVTEVVSPEPESFGLALTGAAGIFGTLVRRRRPGRVF